MRSDRAEFSKPTKREALKRSDGHCEATGTVYGLEPGQRCNAVLGPYREYDHYPVPATERDSDGLENCVVCCKACHSFKTRTLDIPIQAKTKRVSDRHQGIRAPSKWGTRPLGTGNHQHTATRKAKPKIAEIGR